MSPLQVSKWTPYGRNTVYSMLRSGELPSIQYRGTYLISKAELVEYMTAHADDTPRKRFTIKRDSFLIFARRFGYYLLLRRAKIFGHRSQNNTPCCFVHCVRTPLSPPFRKRKNHPIGWFFFLAEREGFEPSCACAQTDFESAPL